MKITLKLTTLALAASLIAGVAMVHAAPKVYKWTDADGQVHFASSPPPGQTAEKVRIRKGVDAPPAAPTAATAAADAKPGEKVALNPEQRAELVKYCSGMRERISTLRQGGRITEKNPDGSKMELDGNMVSEKLRADEGSVRTYCTANGV